MVLLNTRKYPLYYNIFQTKTEDLNEIYILQHVPFSLYYGPIFEKLDTFQCKNRSDRTNTNSKLNSLALQTSTSSKFVRFSKVKYAAAKGFGLTGLNFVNVRSVYSRIRKYFVTS
jgi:hypothetical protein